MRMKLVQVQVSKLTVTTDVYKSGCRGSHNKSTLYVVYTGETDPARCERVGASRSAQQNN